MKKAVKGAAVPPHQLFLHESKTETAPRGITDHSDSLEDVK
ncbi:MAG: hypothetical protein EWM72_00415 [Nitrospira sp.]|nr:MAG: hypothetical protein EWM72_00415 [Nitrospira sp.]